MAHKSRWFPFTAEQTVNILSEFGPLVTMFVVNAIYGKSDPELFHGTIALIATTVLAIAVMQYVLKRLPLFPIIASGVTVTFGLLALLTHNPMWVQIKVTIFNAMFAGVLFGGLYGSEESRHHNSLWAVVGLCVAGLAATLWPIASSTQFAVLRDAVHTEGAMAIFNHLPQIVPVIAIAFGFLVGALLLKQNFFQYSFEKTFHYTDVGWNKFTWRFAWFFVATAIMNEVVRLAFPPAPVEAVAACKLITGAAAEHCLDRYYYNILGRSMDGVNVWAMFKIAVIVPLSGIYAWYLTRLMQKYRIDEPKLAAAAAPAHRIDAA